MHDMKLISWPGKNAFYLTILYVTTSGVKNGAQISGLESI